MPASRKYTFPFIKEMACPFFSLEEGRKDPIQNNAHEYSVNIDVIPGSEIATIWDFDLVIKGCNTIYQSSNKLNTKSTSDQWLELPPQPVNSQIYQKLYSMIKRLSLTSVESVFVREDENGKSRKMCCGFKWITEYVVPKKYTNSNLEGEPDHSKTWHIQIASWIYEKIINKKDLITIDEGYFTLKSGIERWLYLLAKKELQTQKNWVCSAQKLYEISNLQQTKDRFINQIQNLTKKQNLLDVFVKHENKQGQEDLSLVFSC